MSTIARKGEGGSGLDVKLRSSSSTRIWPVMSAETRIVRVSDRLRAPALSAM